MSEIGADPYPYPYYDAVRLSRVPTTVSRVDLPAGTMVMVLNGAANRDPRRFAEPETFDVARPTTRQHIAFGRGVHACPAPRSPGPRAG